MLAPRFPLVSFPALPNLSLSDDEQKVVRKLDEVGRRQRADLELDEAYYAGEQIVRNLRIAVPKELEFLDTILGWGAIPVDPIVERLSIEGFRLPGGTDVDERLSELWDGNGMGAEQVLAYTDALSMRRAYLMVGSSPDGPDGLPRLTVESPLTTSVLWHSDGVTARAAMACYQDMDIARATLLLPNRTITLARNDKQEWEITGRDEHKLDFVSIVRMANNPRTHDRDGRSEITKPMRASIDRTARTLLGLEVARELYSVPQRVILGATESDFVNADGSPKKGWDTYITKVLGLERDEEGNLPQIHQMQPYDPAAFTKIADFEAAHFSGMAAATPQDMGLYTQGNPTSAEALIVSQDRRNHRSRKKQRSFDVPFVEAMQMLVRYQNQGDLPAEFRLMKPDWAPLDPVHVNLVSDGLAKQVEAEMVPATSDVTLKRAGYSAVERRQLEEDRRRDLGQRTLNQIANQGSGDAGAAG